MIQQYDDYFVQKTDAASVTGLSGLQKVTAAMRILAYGVTADAVDEYVSIGESTALKSLRKFCRAIVHIYEAEYLRSPNEEDICRLLRVAENRGFPGMLGSLDCMHWQWNNCPTAWHGHFTGHVHKPTIILEAVASYDCWIWHAFFGMPGSNNDINVLDRSHIFSELAQGSAPPANYVINGHQYTMGYYLADGIYPKWATVVQSFNKTTDNNNNNNNNNNNDNDRLNKKSLFSKMQEAYRKDVERAFGQLQGRFSIVKGPASLAYREDLAYIMKTCIIFHNMIIEDERDDDDNDDDGSTVEFTVSRDETPIFTQFLARHRGIRSTAAHVMLRNDLVEHLWEREGNLE